MTMYPCNSHLGRDDNTGQVFMDHVCLRQWYEWRVKSSHKMMIDMKTLSQTW